MDTASILGFLQESLYIIIAFTFFLFYALTRGKQGITNLILGLYLALLISINFPYYDQILASTAGGGSSNAIFMIVIFVFFTILGTMFFGRLMPRDYEEPAFEYFKTKLLIAIIGAILVTAYSYHVLPVTEFITPGSPIQSLFAPEANFFWWLVLPIITLYFL